MVLSNAQWFAAPAQILTLDDAITEASATTNLKLVLDSGDSSSYGGSGTTWSDVSGNSTDFDFGDGSDTDTYPTFNGTSGDLTNYMSFDNDPAEWFRVNSTSTAAGPAWANTLHKNGAIFTCCTWLYIPTPTGTGEGALTCWSTASAGWVLGFLYRQQEAKQSFLCGISPTTGPLAINKTSDSAFSYDAWHFVGLSVDEPTGSGGGFFYLDGDYDQVGSSDTFDATYSNPTTDDAYNRLSIAIGSASTDQGVPDIGTRIACCAFWQGTAYAKATFDTIYDTTKGRFV
jgi:hypothetical protein